MRAFLNRLYYRLKPINHAKLRSLAIPARDIRAGDVLFVANEAKGIVTRIKWGNVLAMVETTQGNQDDLSLLLARGNPVTVLRQVDDEQDEDEAIQGLKSHYVPGEAVTAESMDKPSRKVKGSRLD